MLHSKLLFLLSVGLLSILPLQLQAGTPEALSLNEILQRHTEAVGGLYHWQKVESLKLIGTVERDGQLADICIIKKRPNKIRATVTLINPAQPSQTIQLIRAHNGTEAWSAQRVKGIQTSEKQILSTGEAQSLLNDANILPPLLNATQGNTTITLESPQQIANNEVYTIKATASKSNEATLFYVDSKTFHVVKSIHTTEYCKTTTLFAEYEKINELYFPRVRTIQDKGENTSILNVSSINIGVGIYEEYFKDIEHASL